MAVNSLAKNEPAPPERLERIIGMNRLARKATRKPTRVSCGGSHDGRTGKSKNKVARQPSSATTSNVRLHSTLITRQ